jgi:RNA polymerase sigma factor (sigma-70 family)
MASAVPELPVVARDQAFEALYRWHLKDVYHYALALLRNPADAEDVTQTTFMNAYRALQRGERVEKPQNWLIKIAHNAARTRYARASRRVKEVPLDEHVEQLAVPEEEKPDVRAVLDALGRLPLNQRAAIVMRELEGRTYAEIADTLNVSVSAVETLIFRARRSLRLKASAIRALTAVPVPSSLSQLLGVGGGSAVVGGGAAAVGTGLLVKAAVVVVAGVVATGVGGDHADVADAAAPTARVATAAVPTSAPKRDVATPKRAAARLAARRVAVRATDARGATTRRSRVPADDAAAKAVPGDAKVYAGTTRPSVSSAASSAPSASVDTVTSAATTTTTPASNVVSTVSNTASSVQPSVPSVTTPSVPSVPVDVPAPPPLPKLP